MQSECHQHLKEYRFLFFFPVRPEKVYALSGEQLSYKSRALTLTSHRSSAQTSNLQVSSRKPAETEDWAECWGLDGGLILTAGGDRISRQ